MCLFLYIKNKQKLLELLSAFIIINYFVPKNSTTTITSATVLATSTTTAFIFHCKG